jgi:hypothetical protein
MASNRKYETKMDIIMLPNKNEFLKSTITPVITRAQNRSTSILLEVPLSMHAKPNSDSRVMWSLLSTVVVELRNKGGRSNRDDNKMTLKPARISPGKPAAICTSFLEKPVNVCINLTRNMHPKGTNTATAAKR